MGCVVLLFLNSVVEGRGHPNLSVSQGLKWALNGFLGLWIKERNCLIKRHVLSSQADSHIPCCVNLHSSEETEGCQQVYSMTTKSPYLSPSNQENVPSSILFLKIAHLTCPSLAKLYWDTKRGTLFGTSQYLNTLSRSFSWIIDGLPSETKQGQDTHVHVKKRQAWAPLEGEAGTEKRKRRRDGPAPSHRGSHVTVSGQRSAEGIQQRAESWGWGCCLHPLTLGRSA